MFVCSGSLQSGVHVEGKTTSDFLILTTTTTKPQTLAVWMEIKDFLRSAEINCCIFLVGRHSCAWTYLPYWYKWLISPEQPSLNSHENLIYALTFAGGLFSARVGVHWKGNSCIGNFLCSACQLWWQLDHSVSSLASLTSREHYVVITTKTKQKRRK